MIKNVLISLLFIVMISCKTATPIVNVDAITESTIDYKQQMENLEQGIYFRATGNEPNWILTISEKAISFTSSNLGFEYFSSPHVEPIRAMDANVKMYRVVTELGTMNIQIQQQECVNTMSGEKSPYTVKIELSKSGQTVNFAGCGEYITDYKLHDIWVLEAMNGAKADKTQFNREFPNMEINTTTNRFSGFGGCNRISGGLFFEKGILRFTGIISTMMACEPLNDESKFLMALQSTTSYTIENRKLTLKNPSGTELVFKKVD